MTHTSGGSTGAEPATRRRPATVAEARALASAVRLRILRICLDEPHTNREIADRLGVNPGTTLHHVRKLVDTGFLAPQRPRRGVRGAREIPYLATRKSWTLTLGDDRSSRDRSIIDAFVQEVALVDPDREGIATYRLGLRLSQEEYQEVIGRLGMMMEELAARPPTPAGRPYSLFVAIHPDVTREPLGPPAAT